MRNLPTALPEFCAVVHSHVAGITHVPVQIEVYRSMERQSLRTRIAFSKVDAALFERNEFHTDQHPFMRLFQDADEFARVFEDARTGIRDLVDQ